MIIVNTSSLFFFLHPADDSIAESDRSSLRRLRYMIANKVFTIENKSSIDK